MATRRTGSAHLVVADRPPVAARWGVGAAAVVYVVYLALLITCDLWRVSPLGFVPRFDDRGVAIDRVAADSIAAQRGLRSGDRITRANGRLMKGPADWQRLRVHIIPSRPLDLEIARADAALAISLPLRSGPGEWRRGPSRPGLIAFRLAQVITLVFAILVGVRRASHPPALMGAWMLASTATVSVILPMELGTFWDALPRPLGLLLWMPFASSVAAGPLLFAFLAVFPTRLLSGWRLAAALAPALLTVAWYVDAWSRIVLDRGSLAGTADTIPVMFIVNVIYAALAFGLLVLHQRAAGTPTERRRIDVLSLGTVVGGLAGAGVVLGYWLNPGADIFATRTLTVLALAFLAFPASFAYAILRHRLFDVGLIVRQGLQYALARRFVDALGPILAAILLTDIVMHRDQPLATIVRSRWWWFALLAAALFVVRARREQWLRHLDRRFFRDRYDAQRLLRSIVDQIARASSVDAIVPSVLQQIDEALHPEFAAVLGHEPGDAAFRAIAVSPVRDRPWSTLPASLTVIAVLSALRKPLALSLGQTAWVRQQLPLDERALLLEHGIELLVPVSGDVPGEPPLALLVLGPRRSEEPYSQEDLDLLVAIAQAVAVLLERSSAARPLLAECERCGRCYDPRADRCSEDGEALVRSAGSRILNGRYRLERRLGRGGMGAVYAAVDEVLERTVAVKVIRHDAAAPMDLASRFREEARAAAGFAHPHVVRVYDFGVDRDRRPFLVMELLEGETLRQRLAGGLPLTAADTLHILRGVCSALSAAHGRGLVHRDLKPENIFLVRHASGMIPKVLDFGLAKAFAPGRSSPAPSTTSAGLLLGTLEYMAPEQVAGDEVHPGWDLWALGVIAFEMLTARHPFRHAVSAHEEPWPGAIVPAGSGAVRSEAIDALFRAALSTERARRPHDPLEFLAAAERVLA